MILTTTPQIEGKQIVEYKQIVFGEVVVRDFIAGITDIIGGRSGVYESRLSRAREEALEELAKRALAVGANAVVGIEVNYTTMGAKNMFVISASGTAVVVR